VLTWADGAVIAQELSESDAVTNVPDVVTGRLGAASAAAPPLTSPLAGAICRCGECGGVQQRLKSSSSKSKLVNEADELDAAAKRQKRQKSWWQ
jgi:hypothetical protein